MAWLVHFAHRDPVELHYWPPATEAEVLAEHPEALAAEPARRVASNSIATEAERSELLALVQAIYAGDTDADRQQAIDAALADPASALTCYRAISKARGIVPAAAPAPVQPALQPPGCSTCQHRRKPGHSAGYCCADRADLVPAYGTNHPLRRLPADGGDGCQHFRPAKWVTA